MTAAKRAAWAIASALALVAATVALPATAAEQSPADAWTSADVGFSEGASTDGLVGRLPEMDAYAGPKKPWIRLDLNWWTAQSCATCEPTFDHLDPVVDAAHARGLRVLIILAYSPPWATGGKGDKAFPVSDAHWQRIVDATVAHFGDKVQAYEVWNEPNLVHFATYGNGTVAERRLRYWQLVRIAHERVEAGCATCVVLAGASANGTAESEQRNDNESAQWLDWAYANGYGDTFHAVTHHPYAAWNSGFGPARPECRVRWWNMFGPDDPACGELAAVRAVMVRHGDGDKKIWGTEFGYPTAGDGISPQSRAAIRDHLVEGVRMWRARDYTGPLFIYSYRDSPQCRPATSPECHFGLTDRDGVPKAPIYNDLMRALIG